MFSESYFIGGFSGGFGEGSLESSELVVIDGDVYYNQSKEIYIDENQNIYMGKANHNAVLNSFNGEIFVEKVG